MTTRPAPTGDPAYVRVVDDLAYEYDGVFSRASVERAVAEAREALEPRATVTDFLPVLVRRFARDQLLAAAQADGRIAKAMPEILFVCVHNAGRSQLAAALAQHLSGGRVRVRSAGSAPADEINPHVVTVLAERGIDLAETFPKPLTDRVVQAADVIVTMGCGDACPVYPGKRYLDWTVSDPHGQSLETVRDIRDDVQQRVTVLLRELGL
ncbi:arsenate reductase ArsC [Nostocoides sp. F2B08]|uniref:arsenate-mycothiol transferase ArsC n=1 Tax=Nostocoides sp. F2B08 TaxID=2653936 RepID=UPI0012630746|nr:arsenate reductase ArsC [Tetrasphaera sp. F2B08]KAB7741418.1 arsenate reductase ArsC [Tetrasphaera sp. F2B08]